MCRNIGPIVGLSQLFFGHEACAPREADRCPFNPNTDIRPTNLLAIAMNDEDAREWGRAFDIVYVDEIAEGGQLKVTYYQCQGVERGAAPPEDEQINSVWVQGKPGRRGFLQGTIHVKSVLCPTWVEPPGKGFIWDQDKVMLRSQLQRLRLGGGD